MNSVLKSVGPRLQVDVRVSYVRAINDLVGSLLSALAIKNEALTSAMLSQYAKGFVVILDLISAGRPVSGMVPHSVLQLLSSFRPRNVVMTNGDAMAFSCVFVNQPDGAQEFYNINDINADVGLTALLQAYAQLDVPLIDLEHIDDGSISIDGVILPLGGLGPVAFYGDSSGLMTRTGIKMDIRSGEHWTYQFAWCSPSNMLQTDALYILQTDYLAYAAGYDTVRVGPGLHLSTVALKNSSVFTSTVFQYPALSLPVVAAFIYNDLLNRVPSINTVYGSLFLAYMSLARIALNCGFASFWQFYANSSYYQVPSAIVEACCATPTFVNRTNGGVVCRLPVVDAGNSSADLAQVHVGVYTITVTPSIDLSKNSIDNNNYVNMTAAVPLLATQYGRLWADGNSTISITAFMPEVNTVSRTISCGPLSNPGCDVSMGPLGLSAMEAEVNYTMSSSTPDFVTINILNHVNYYGTNALDTYHLKQLALLPLMYPMRMPNNMTPLTGGINVRFPNLYRNRITIGGGSISGYLRAFVTEPSAHDTSYQALFKKLSIEGMGANSLLGEFKKHAMAIAIDQGRSFFGREDRKRLPRRGGPKSSIRRPSSKVHNGAVRPNARRKKGGAQSGAPGPASRKHLGGTKRRNKRK
jgi:hypothetical protein